MHDHIFPSPPIPQPLTNNTFKYQPYLVNHNHHTTNYAQSSISSPHISAWLLWSPSRVFLMPELRSYIPTFPFVKETTATVINDTLLLSLYSLLISNTTIHISNSTSSTFVSSLIWYYIVSYGKYHLDQWRSVGTSYALLTSWSNQWYVFKRNRQRDIDINNSSCVYYLLRR